MNASNRNRLTFELSDGLLEALISRAKERERSLSGQIRHALNVNLGLPEETEIRDTTPSLPGMP